MKIYLSSIWRRDSNWWPSDCESPPLTSGPGLPLIDFCYLTIILHYRQRAVPCFLCHLSFSRAANSGQLIIFFLYCRPRSINIGHIFSFGKVSSHGPGFKNPSKKNIYAMERFSHSNFYLFLHFWITFKCEQMLRTDIIKDLMNLEV